LQAAPTSFGGHLDEEQGLTSLFVDEKNMLLAAMERVKLKTQHL